MFKKAKTSALASPIGRRAVLAKLGMVAGAAYAAPVLLSLSPAHASSSGGASAASANSYSAPSAQSYSAPSARSAPSRASGPSSSSYSSPSRNSNSGSSFSGGRGANGRPRLAPNGMTWEEYWAMLTGRG